MFNKRAEFLPFSRPSINEGDIAAVAEVLRSGWITTGPRATAFEQAVCDTVGCAGAVALSSATAGLHVVMKALGIGPGDEVITPSLTWVSTANLIVLAGATPVFVDVDRDSLMVSEASIRAAVSERTRLIVPVHFAGSAVDMAPIRQIAGERGIILVEDAAHALGTRYRDEPIGRRGTSIFSFHAIKNVTTGEGGMVCSDDAELLDRVKRLKFHGLGVDAFDRQTLGRSPQAEVLEPGYKYNLPDMAAVLGLRQLARIDRINGRRAELAGLYREKLAEVPEILPLQEVPHCTQHAWHLFVVRLDTDKAGCSRETFMSELKARNIGTGLHFRAIHTQKYYRETLGCRPGSLPQTEWNSERICSLPLFPDMRDEDVDDVVDAIKDVLIGIGRR
jgi:UDP-4-amino-4-deoxy-L-arabinose-oxoglutarate aminotransferase